MVSSAFWKQHALGVRENQRPAQVKRRVIEYRKLARGALAQPAHHFHQRGRRLQRLPHLPRQVFGHQPRGLAFHHRQPRARPVVVLPPLLDELVEVVVLVRQGMREFVRQHRVLGLGRRGVGDEQLFLFVIVKGRGLFGQQFHRALGQVEIRGHQAEFLERELLGVDLFRLGHFLHPLLQKLGDLLFADEVAGHRMQQLHAGDDGQFLGDAVRLAAERLGPWVRLCRRNSGQKQRRGRQQRPSQQFKTQSIPSSGSMRTK